MNIRFYCMIEIPRNRPSTSFYLFLCQLPQSTASSTGSAPQAEKNNRAVTVHLDDFWMVGSP